LAQVCSAQSYFSCNSHHRTCLSLAMIRGGDDSSIKANYEEVLQGLSERDRQFVLTCNKMTCHDSTVATMRRKVELTRNAPVHLIAVNGFITQPNFQILRFLCDELKVKTLSAKILRYRPLDLAIIWGLPDVVVYLLSRGADPMFHTDSSAVKKARDRQRNLQDAFDKGVDGAEYENFVITKAQIKPLLEEGLGMIKVLEGVQSHGCYRDWALANFGHPLVQRFSRAMRTAEDRYQLVLIRALVSHGRAALFSDEDRVVISEKAAAEAAKRAREERSVQDVLKDAGFDDRLARMVCDTFGVTTMKSLQQSKLPADVVEKQLEILVRQGHMVEGQRRRFARIVREVDEPVAETSKAVSSKPEPKSVAKSKAKASAAPGNAALLALASKNAGYAKAAPKSKKSTTVVKVDAIALAFAVDLPDSSFMVITRFLYCT